MQFVSGLKLADFDRLMSLEMQATAFVTEWLHCDQIANFIGTALASDQPDSFRYGNLVSTLANEVMESVYWQNNRNGSITLDVISNQQHLGFSIHIPVSSEHDRFFRDFLAQTSSKTIKVDYQQLLSAKDSSVSGLHGLMELLVSYNAQWAYQSPVASEALAQLAVIIDIQSAMAG